MGDTKKLPLAEICRLFLVAERKTNIGKLKLFGVQIWPLIRMQLLAANGTNLYQNTALNEYDEQFILEAVDELAREGMLTTDSWDSEHLSWRDRIYRDWWCQKMTGYNGDLLTDRFQETKILSEEDHFRRETRMERIREYRAKIKCARQNYRTEVLKSLPSTLTANNTDYLIFGRSGEHYQSAAEGYFAPVVDSWSQQLKKSGTVTKLLVKQDGRTLQNPAVSIDVVVPNNLFPLFYEQASKTSIYADFPSHGFRKLIKLRNQLREIDSFFNFSATKILIKLYTDRKNSVYYRVLLEQMKPKAIFFTSFAGLIPLVWAANDLKIPTIDLQHGGMPEFHGLLSHYNRIPKKGYSLLPSDYWCWSRESADTISKWLSRSNGAHQVHAVGHPWWSNEMVKMQRRNLKPNQIDFMNSLKGRRVALVTLVWGPLGGVPDALVHAVRKCGDDVYWLIRMHPINRADPGPIHAKLVGLDDYYNVEEATELPLPLLMGMTSVHLTADSTSWKEASGLGVRTAFWYVNAVSSHGDEPFKLGAKITTTSDQICDFVKNAEKDTPAGHFSMKLHEKRISDLLETMPKRRMSN